jgi:hypothetical protein
MNLSLPLRIFLDSAPDDCEDDEIPMVPHCCAQSGHSAVS